MIWYSGNDPTHTLEKAPGQFVHLISCILPTMCPYFLGTNTHLLQVSLCPPLSTMPCNLLHTKMIWFIFVLVHFLPTFVLSASTLAAKTIQLQIVLILSLGLNIWVVALNVVWKISDFKIEYKKKIILYSNQASGFGNSVTFAYKTCKLDWDLSAFHTSNIWFMSQDWDPK